MKKIIVIAIISMLSFGLTYGQTKDRVKIEVRGFDDNQQTLLLASQYTAQKAAAVWQLVDSDPEFILRIQNRTTTMQTWMQTDRKAQTRNNVLRTADNAIQQLIWAIPGYSRTAYIARNVGANMARGQLQSRTVPENFQMETVRSTVEVILVDAKTNKVLSKGIGINTITVKTLRQYGFEPFTVLADGDLSSVGIGQGENLAVTYKQLLQLSAFMKADLPENQIVR